MEEILSVITSSAKETMLVGEKLGNTVGKGVVFTLVGDLGAGKTHFVKGFAKGVGSEELVTSPTFTLLNVYENGKMPIYHFDMYRLSSAEEGQELGFDEYFDLKSLDGVVLVEWPEKVEGLINCPHIQIKIEKLGDEKRKITIASEGGQK